MPGLLTTTLALPNHISREVWAKAQTGSAVAALSGQTPMLFGKTDVMTFTAPPKAQFVAEGGNKSETPATFAPKTVVPHKAQVTVRFSNEVMWADEDYQLGILDELGRAMSVALSRALDLGALHGLDPLSGAAAASITDKVVGTTGVGSVVAESSPDTEIESAAGLVVAKGYTPTGVALDTGYAFTLATSRYEDGRKKFPDLAITSGLQTFEGLAAAVSSTVSAPEAKTATGVKAVVGDWSALRWGVQREIGIKLIEFGDPDGQGDLQRMNQVALRAETVFGWAVLAPEAFAVVKASA